MQTTKQKPIPTIKRSSVTVDRTANVPVDGTDARDFCVGNYEMVTGRDKAITLWRKLRFHSFFAQLWGIINWQSPCSESRRQVLLLKWSSCSWLIKCSCNFWATVEGSTKGGAFLSGLVKSRSMPISLLPFHKSHPSFPVHSKRTPVVGWQSASKRVSILIPSLILFWILSMVSSEQQSYFSRFSLARIVSRSLYKVNLLIPNTSHTRILDLEI